MKRKISALLPYVAGYRGSAQGPRAARCIIAVAVILVFALTAGAVRLSAAEENEQADKAEETCRRYLPSVGKTVEVPCEKAEPEAEVEEDLAKKSSDANDHAFIGKWSNSQAACTKAWMDERERQIIFGAGTAQYMRGGSGFTCTGARISKGSSANTFVATCISSVYCDEPLCTTRSSSSGDLALHTNGDQLVGLGPDGQSLLLNKCN